MWKANYKCNVPFKVGDHSLKKFDLFRLLGNRLSFYKGMKYITLIITDEELVGVINKSMALNSDAHFRGIGRANEINERNRRPAYKRLPELKEQGGNTIYCHSLGVYCNNYATMAEYLNEHCQLNRRVQSVAVSLRVAKRTYGNKFWYKELLFEVIKN